MELQLSEVMTLKMHLIQFVSIVNWIQMKWMKVIVMMKNMMNKAFQHYVESGLIEVIKMTMQMIEFVSIVNLIQIKLMKGIHMMKNLSNKEFQNFQESKSETHLNQTDPQKWLLAPFGRSLLRPILIRCMSQDSMTADHDRWPFCLTLSRELNRLLFEGSH
jgi:hypothetical protein